MRYFRANWPDVKVTPKMHMLEKHTVDFLAKWGAGFGYYGEQGGESLHKEFNELNRTYSVVPSSKSRMEYILHEHHRRGNPEARALQPEKKKRKASDISL